MFQDLKFRYPFRKYQLRILAQVDQNPGDRKLHLVAPPGSGKTIVGLELVRRNGAPAVVFAPTTTIQRQWREKVAMFLKPGLDSGEETRLLETLTSTDPYCQAPVNIFTYQLIATPAQAQAYVREMAVDRWKEELEVEGRLPDRLAAAERLEILMQNNPAAYRTELGKRCTRLKRELLRGGQAQVEEFLHPNARRLIQALVDYGVRTVVLDECHHLLDYWAIVLRYLISQLPDVQVVGLTATLPSPEEGAEGRNYFENYTALLGEVDFEVPTPAVVKEGDLAPYRDLAYFTQPSQRELDYLANLQHNFEQALAAVETDTCGLTLSGWTRHVLQTAAIPNAVLPVPKEAPISAPEAGDDEPAIVEPAGLFDAFPLRYPDESENEDLPAALLTRWESFLLQQPRFSLAALRYLNRLGKPLSPGVLLPLEASEPMEMDDWAVLLERYGLDYLKLSADPADHERFNLLRRTLLPFGFTLTERGLRQTRSAGELVLTFSESKDAAVADILSIEQRALGDRLRAVVVTDFERMSSSASRVKDVLDRDAGSALRVFARLASIPEFDRLRPILATGSTLLADDSFGPELVERFNATLQGRGLNAACRKVDRPSPHYWEISGEGPDWTPGVYISLVTAAFDAGLTRCLVGTRGIFGEGWDTLSLNTLIDLTSVTTSTAVQQLRGRGLRKDPAWPRKVAHNWDVICVAPQYEKGDADLRRLVRRHERYWGIVPDFPGAIHWGRSGQAAGTVVRGLSHISPHLAYDLARRGFHKVDFPRYTQQARQAAPERERSYHLWDIGGDYSLESFTSLRVDVRDLKVHTVASVQNTLNSMLLQLWKPVSAALLSLGWINRADWAGTLLARWSGVNLERLFSGIEVLLLAITGAALLSSLVGVGRLVRFLRTQQPPDSILLDVGRALLLALRDARLLSQSVGTSALWVEKDEDGSCQIYLDHDQPGDVSLFMRSYREIFAPVSDQRYLILRDDGRMPVPLFTPLWRLLRLAQDEYPPAYHPVPKALSSSKTQAQLFARHWRRWVGGGRLVFTRSEAGRKTLLAARQQARPAVKDIAFEIWR